MKLMTLISEIVQMLFDTIKELQAEIADLKISHTSISSSEKCMSLLLSVSSPADSILTLKFEKFSDLLMFNSTRKEL